MEIIIYQLTDYQTFFEPSFPAIASNGLIDVFNLDQAAQIVNLVERINQNAVAVS